MAKKQQVNERRTLIQELIAKGLTRQAAAGQADKILGEQDRVEVDRKGTERPATVGPPL